MALSYIITESNTLGKLHCGLRQIAAGADVPNRKKDNSWRQSGIVRRAPYDDKAAPCDQKTTSKSSSLIPVNQFSGKDDTKSSLPGTQIQLNGTLGVTGAGYALNIQTHFLNDQCASDTAVTGIMRRATSKYREAQAFSSRPNSTYEINV
jgi:hypothetical protein